MELFNRFELKYILPWQEAEKFRHQMKAHVLRDPHAGSKGHYHINSLYYDSPDYKCFWEKIEGLKVRRKVRIRAYGENENKDDVFLEIKQRTNRTIQKRRIRCSKKTVLPLLNGLNDNAWDETIKNNHVLSEVNFLYHWYQLEPKAVISYQREAFQGIYNDRLRITFDTNLRYRMHFDLDPTIPPDHDLYLIHPELVVLEIKFNEKIPIWLTRMIQCCDFQINRISKYCESIAKGVYQERY